MAFTQLEKLTAEKREEEEKASKKKRNQSSKPRKAASNKLKTKLKAESREDDDSTRLDVSEPSSQLCPPDSDCSNISTPVCGLKSGGEACLPANASPSKAGLLTTLKIEPLSWVKPRQSCYDFDEDDDDGPASSVNNNTSPPKLSPVKPSPVKPELTPEPTSPDKPPPFLSSEKEIWKPERKHGSSDSSTSHKELKGHKKDPPLNTSKVSTKDSTKRNHKVSKKPSTPLTEIPPPLNGFVTSPCVVTAASSTKSPASIQNSPFSIASFVAPGAKKVPTNSNHTPSTTSAPSASSLAKSICSTSTSSTTSTSVLSRPNFPTHFTPPSSASLTSSLVSLYPDLAASFARLGEAPPSSTTPHPFLSLDRSSAGPLTDNPYLKPPFPHAPPGWPPGVAVPFTSAPSPSSGSRGLSGISGRASGMFAPQLPQHSAQIAMAAFAQAQAQAQAASFPPGHVSGGPAIGLHPEHMLAVAHLGGVSPDYIRAELDKRFMLMQATALLNGGGPALGHSTDHHRSPFANYTRPPAGSLTTPVTSTGSGPTLPAPVLAGAGASGDPMAAAFRAASQGLDPMQQQLFEKYLRFALPGGGFPSGLPHGSQSAPNAVHIQRAFQPKTCFSSSNGVQPYMLNSMMQDRDRQMQQSNRPQRPSESSSQHRKHGRWCDMHVRIAWRIFHAQQPRNPVASSDPPVSRPNDLFPPPPRALPFPPGAEWPNFRPGAPWPLWNPLGGERESRLLQLQQAARGREPTEHSEPKRRRLSGATESPMSLSANSSKFSKSAVHTALPPPLVPVSESNGAALDLKMTHKSSSSFSSTNRKSAPSTSGLQVGKKSIPPAASPVVKVHSRSSPVDVKCSQSGPALNGFDSVPKSASGQSTGHSSGGSVDK